MLRTISKGLVKGLKNIDIREQVDSIQTTALLRLARIREESWSLEETCCHSNSSERPSANAGGKNSQGEYIKKKFENHKLNIMVNISTNQKIDAI